MERREKNVDHVPRSAMTGAGVLASQFAYWIVPPGEKVRHATMLRPGAWIQGGEITVLCGRAMKAPYATPYGRKPRTAEVTGRCEDCQRGLVNATSADWDA